MNTTIWKNTSLVRAEVNIDVVTSRLLGIFGNHPNFSEENVEELRTLISENELGENESFKMARDRIVGINERDYQEFKIGQILYTMMIHIHYYREDNVYKPQRIGINGELKKKERLNFINRNIEKTAKKVVSLISEREKR